MHDNLFCTGRKFGTHLADKPIFSCKIETTEAQSSIAQGNINCRSFLAQSPQVIHHINLFITCGCTTTYKLIHSFIDSFKRRYPNRHGFLLNKSVYSLFETRKQKFYRWVFLEINLFKYYKLINLPMYNVFIIIKFYCICKISVPFLFMQWFIGKFYSITLWKALVFFCILPIFLSDY